jgi:hypothetical protein
MLFIPAHGSSAGVGVGSDPLTPAPEAIRFTDEGKHIKGLNISQRMSKSMRKVQSVANFLDRPILPNSPIPSSMPLTKLRRVVTPIRGATSREDFACPGGGGARTATLCNCILIVSICSVPSMQA